ncbi:MAG: alpha/beta hydrolase [Bdellovibrionales bacterium]
MNFTIPVRYLLRGPADRGTAVLLHGYQDHAQSMAKRLGWLEAELPFQVLAINGPFPVPIWKATGFVEAYSWYFRDTSRDLMIVSPDDTAQKVAEMIRQLVGDGPVVLVGFSQGGYLAPFIAQVLPSVRAIIAMGSGYPPEPYKGLDKVKIYGLHGDQDERIPIQSSKQAHAELLQSGLSGEFRVIPGLDHKVDPILEPTVRGLVLQELKG